MSRHPERASRVGRTRDWRDCQHCSHYNGRGNSGGTPPWSVCQFWPRRAPASCDSYAYEHRPWLNENGESWALATPAIEAGEVQRSETSELKPPAVGEEGGGA